MVSCFYYHTHITMQVTINRRAEIALRSLSQKEQEQISRAIDDLRAMSQKDFYKHDKLKKHYKLISLAGEELYIFRGNQSIRLVLSATDDACIVEEILDHNRLKRLLPERGKQLLPV